MAVAPWLGGSTFGPTSREHDQRSHSQSSTLTDQSLMRLGDHLDSLPGSILPPAASGLAPLQRVTSVGFSSSTGSTPRFLLIVCRVD